MLRFNSTARAALAEKQELPAELASAIERIAQLADKIDATARKGYALTPTAVPTHSLDEM
jgi:hypothetical protein